MLCPTCNHETVPGAKFCSQCGARMTPRCPHCGIELLPDARFCHDCGAALQVALTAPSPTLEQQFTTFEQALPDAFRAQLRTPDEGENRLVTVLFADMSRSVETTRDLHPEDAAALVNGLLKAMVDALVQHGGRIDRFLGDGVLAVFGVPQAHESDPERAILAALSIREAAGTLGLEVTAGINTGEVYVGGMGSERHQEVTVMGPVVNLAARMQAAAEPGQILVGEATYRHTRRAFAFTPRVLEIRGFDRSVPAHAVTRALPRPEKVRGIEGLRAELIGRDEELARLREALDTLLRGEGQVVTLIGEAGVGKSRLVNELKGAAGERSVSLLWLEGRCLELGMTASYWPFIDFLRHYLGWGPEEGEAERAERLVAALSRLVAEGHLSEARLDEIGPLLGNLLAVRFGNDWDARLRHAGPEEVKHRTFTALRDFLVALSRRQPLLLVLEDLHWADSLSLDLISLLMETVTLAPILLFCVYRPERDHKCWHLGAIALRKCPERYTGIVLRELTPSQSRRLVEVLLTIDNLPGTVKEAILERSGGNPFFVEEVVRSLIDAEMVYQEGEVWRAREEIETITIPESIQSVIQSRLDRLEEELRHVLQSAAVIGRLFRRRLLARVTQNEGELERALWQLEELALIYQERVVPEEEYSFQHALTQETVYQNMVRRRRAGFHRQVAEAIEALYADNLEAYYEPLAYHYERSGVEAKAIGYLLKAGEKARRAYLNEDAIRAFTHVLERLEALEAGPAREEARLQAFQGLGRIAVGTGDVEKAVHCCRQAVALADALERPLSERVRLRFWVGDALFWCNGFKEMVKIGEEGLALLGEETESLEAALMNHLIGVGASQIGDRAKAHDHWGRNAAMLERLPYAEELRAVYPSTWEFLLHTRKQLGAARHVVELLERGARENHDLRALGDVHRATATILEGQGDLRGALARQEEAREIFARIGDIKHQSWCLLPMGGLRLELGQVEAALQLQQRSLELSERMGMRRDVGRSWRAIGISRLCLGDIPAANEAVANAASILDEGAHPTLRINAGLALGRVLLARGERERAMERLRALCGETLQRGVRRFLPALLSSLEAACPSSEAFRALCEELRRDHGEIGGERFQQWYLEPAQPDYGFRILDFGLPTSAHQIRNPISEIQNAEWVWVDPFGDCSWRGENGLRIHAANGRDLWQHNMSAPRLLRDAGFSWLAVETVCAPPPEPVPAIGGLLLWRDPANFLRLDVGTRGAQEIRFAGSIGNEDTEIGRGRLGEGAVGADARVFLRLELAGARVRALCSADGEQWFIVGDTEFPEEGPVQVGVHAIGNIDRTVYPGAHSDGTAIRFEAFQVWS